MEVHIQFEFYFLKKKIHLNDVFDNCPNKTHTNLNFNLFKSIYDIDSKSL